MKACGLLLVLKKNIYSRSQVMSFFFPLEIQDQPRKIPLPSSKPVLQTG